MCPGIGIARSQVEGNAAVSGETVEDRRGERGHNRFRVWPDGLWKVTWSLACPVTKTRGPPVPGGSLCGRRISGCDVIELHQSSQNMR